jgi:hypothetical protein
MIILSTIRNQKTKYRRQKFVFRHLSSFVHHPSSIVHCLFTVLCLLSAVSYSLAGVAVSPTTEQSEFIQEAKKAIDGADAFMGDWQGSWKANDLSATGPLAAQVIYLGNGQYKANLLEEFDKQTQPISVLEGEIKGATVYFTGHNEQEGAAFTVKAAIEGGKFTGSIRGKDKQGQDLNKSFEMEKVFRVSPTLGAKPPDGALILFNGTNFDQWEHTGTFVGRIGIAEFIANQDNAVAYLRSKVWSDKQQQAVLEMGSDDGIKVWLNGEVVHANNTGRPLAPRQDKKQVTLKEQWNDLLVKVTNGSGGWEVCVRLANSEGKLLDGIKCNTGFQPVISQDTARMAVPPGTDEYYKKNGGFLSLWEIAGPYQEQGKDFKALFDVAFEPEKPDAKDVQWKQIDMNKIPTDKVRWKLADGAMQVVSGTGSIVTKKKFKDFKLHMEFCTPFMPAARGQARGNSGVYLQGRYEIQILDSYGLKQRFDDCGGIYGIGVPLVNMCAPPLQWQTYDITFQAPRFDAEGKKVSDAQVTVVHNGVTIHENLKLPKTTTLALDNNVKEAGGICLQDHGNEVQFRNIWLVESP